jgi:hypothetical protein
MLQLLQISRNIFYAHHYFEIKVVIRPAGTLHMIAVFLAASPLSFSMQLVKTTDISQCSQLLVFVHCMHADAIKGNSYSESLLETTKAIDILEMVTSFFFTKQNFDQKEKLHTPCTDEAPVLQRSAKINKGQC